jgi:membrane-associated phospholipid phosphatase
LPISYRFPTGHALVSCCFVGLLAAMVAIREKRRHVRTALWAAAATLTALIGLSRIYLGCITPAMSLRDIWRRSPGWRP